MEKVAILVDGAFFKKRAKVIYGDLGPEQLAEKLMSQCYGHLRKHSGNKVERYTKIGGGENQ